MGSNKFAWVWYHLKLCAEGFVIDMFCSAHLRARSARDIRHTIWLAAHRDTDILVKNSSHTGR